MTRIIAAYLPAAAWAAFVLFVGGLPDVDAPRFLDFPGADKLVHFAMYGVLGVLLMVGHRWTRARHTVVWLLLLVAAMAAGDEVRQGVVPGRSPDAMDWMADVIGAGAGFLVLRTFLGRDQGGRDES